MRAHIQGLLNHYSVKLQMQVVVYCRFPLIEVKWNDNGLTAGSLCIVSAL